MKNLSKLIINSRKIMRSNELIAIRGGYGSDNCCDCWGGFPIELKESINSTKSACHDDCEEKGYFYGLWMCPV